MRRRTLLRKYRTSLRICTYPCCEDAAQSLGFCQKHYRLHLLVKKAKESANNPQG